MLRRLAILAVAPCSLLACAAAEAPPPPPPAIEVAPPVPAAPPPLLVVPRAEASPTRAHAANVAEVPPLRSEGKRHAIERTVDGVLVMSEERGVLGFLRSPAAGKEIRWAGFVEDDAVLVVAGDAIFRAANVDDALAGKLDPAGSLDPAATVIASAGKLFVAAAPDDGGAFVVSTDGGRRFAPARRPAKGRIVDVAARGDGFALVAVERTKDTADVFTGRGARGWAKGPVAQVNSRLVFAQGGDSIVFTEIAKKAGEAGRRVGLDPRGRWIPAGHPDSWLSFAWTSLTFEVSTPVRRPGFPAPPPKDSDGAFGVIGGVVGGVLGGLRAECRGIACLAERSPAGGPPRARAFADGVCAKEHVVSRTETIPVWSPSGGSEREVTQKIDACDAAAPARRAATLIVGKGDRAPLVKLPIACASGRIVGTDRASFVECDGKHRGRASLLHVAATGALTEVASGGPADRHFGDAESASDGTTVLFAEDATLLCRTDAPACTPIARAGLLTARPLPFGRALVARSGARADELVLELLGEPGAARVEVRVTSDVHDLEVTADGHVRLWQRAQGDAGARAGRGARRRATPLEASLVRVDGSLVPDPSAPRSP